MNTNTSFVLGQRKNANILFVSPQPLISYTSRVENRLKEIRKELGITQTQLAERCDASLQMIQYLENGQRQITQKWMEKFSKVLGVPMYALFVDPKSILDGFDQELVSRYHASPEHIKKTIGELLGLAQA
jgi:transcriptional regulator with XRE-family HTH domain